MEINRRNKINVNFENRIIIFFISETKFKILKELEWFFCFSLL